MKVNIKQGTGYLHLNSKAKAYLLTLQYIQGSTNETPKVRLGQVLTATGPNKRIIGFISRTSNLKRLITKVQGEQFQLNISQLLVMEIKSLEIFQ